MRNKNQLRTSAIIATLALLICAIGTFAYFTDRIESQASISTIKDGINILPIPDPDIIPDDPDLPDPEDYEDPTPDDQTDDLTNLWAYLNSKAIVNYNPGDKMNLSYILTNQSTLAVDIRETFIVTSSVPMTEGAPEFALFTSISPDEFGGFMGTGRTAPAGATITVERLSATQYKYVIQYYTMEKPEENAPSALGREYYIVFAGNASNDFQKATCTVDYVVEAKQHSEGGAADWAVATTGTLTLPGSNVSLPVVPAN